MMGENVRVRERVETQTAVETETREKESTGRCPHCGADVGPDYEICPVCGWKMVDYCTFCGAPMRPDDMDCPECGMPADGVMCPSCNILNFRSFCRQCGQPLSRAARRAVEKARQDPKVQESARLLTRIAELEAELAGDLPGAAGPDEPAEPTEGELRLRELMSHMGFAFTEQPKATRRSVGRSRETVMQEYQRAVEEANNLLESMLPPAGSTPQEQRNYYTARKVAVTELVEVTGLVGWVCNWCHCFHDNPSQCYRPWLGGTWQYGSAQKVVTTYKKV